MNKIKVGIIGGGINSVIGHCLISAVLMDGRAELVSGYFSKNKNINTKTQKKFNIPVKIFDNIESYLIEQKKIKTDIIIIATPSNSHADHITKCLKYDLNIVCEKPIVTKLEDFLKIKKILSKKKLFFSVVHNYIGYPMIKELKEIIRKKKIGKVNQITCEMPQESFLTNLPAAGESKKVQSWRLKENIIPNLYLDLGIHVDYLINFIIQKKPISVIANSSNYSKYKSIIDNLWYWIKYKNNVTADIWLSKTAIGSSNSLSIKVFGNKGSLEWYHSSPEKIVWSNIIGEKKILERRSKLITASKKSLNRFKAGHPGGFTEAYANFYNEIFDEFNYFKKNKKKSNKFNNNFLNTFDSLLLGKNISKSIKKKKWIKF